MGGELQVSPGDLRKLSTQHRQVASDIAAADMATRDTGVNVGSSHGLVCSLTTAAVLAAEQSRTKAAKGMQAVSHDLAGKLDSAASQYEGTDRQEGGHLDGQMHPG
ncbi:ESX-1 secretion-associated protein [Mycobacterium branderi]|uniref:ESX-1 secretion-associated protein n=1 Tax=Mycobacterium branderi TaxID=43348 RepID=A0A7I7W404_9MYCO|nr:ESX-1 secretion-associated protein [Mycobacterium branderi]MCV7234857.1 ESX-1 secretion-associated protein [Mycobacterium branderi]ORA33557.1 hypothetical protein BST20_22025 [Mycobacterium branderi]BBZ11515.1 ESX-1 secretion-associated protein [Mycobacterium branderi]